MSESANVQAQSANVWSANVRQQMSGQQMENQQSSWHHRTTSDCDDFETAREENCGSRLVYPKDVIADLPKLEALYKFTPFTRDEAYSSPKLSIF